MPSAEHAFDSSINNPGSQLLNIAVHGFQIWLSAYDQRLTEFTGQMTVRQAYPDIIAVIPILSDSVDKAVLDSWCWEMIEAVACSLEDGILDSEEVSQLITVAASHNSAEHQEQARYIAHCLGTPTLADISHSNQTQLIDLHDLMRNFDLLINARNNQCTSKETYFAFSQADQTYLRALAQVFSYVYSLMNQCAEKSNGRVPTFVLGKVLEIIIAQTRNSLTRLVTADSISKNGNIQFILPNITTVFDIIEQIPLQPQDIECGRLIETLIPYLQDMIHIRYSYHIDITFSDERQNRHSKVRIHQPTLVTAIYNLIADACVHGSYPNCQLNVSIKLSDSQVTGYQLLQVTNPIDLDQKTMEQLCAQLGRRRVVLSNSGQVLQLSETDIVTHGLHGNGKRSVRAAWIRTLQQLGTPTNIISQFESIHWQHQHIATAVDQPISTTSDDTIVGATRVDGASACTDSTQHYLLTCNFPLQVQNN